MYEYAGNLHVHTTYSDGEWTHAAVAAAAARAGLDFIVITDHNVWVRGIGGLYETRDGRRVLLLTGEEVHDMLRAPQRNHLLVYGAGREMAPEAQAQPAQHLIDAVRDTGGLAFIAHPVDQAVGWAHEGCYAWVDWDVTGYTGIELWNTMSSVKDMIPNLLVGIPALLDPTGAITGPNPDALRLWDELLKQGQRVLAIGNADAHGTLFQVGPFKKSIYPYEFLFRAVNTHVLLESPLTGDSMADGPAIYAALAQGRAFVGYGVPGDPRGFRFAARHGANVLAQMGDTIPLADCEMLHVVAPAEAHLRLICDGQPVADQQSDVFSYRPEEPGAYRVEAWKSYRGRERGWIFSNPIFLT